MGFNTDFVGHVMIDPPLNAAETEYLTAFNRTRHWDRHQGPYVVLDHPMSPDPHDHSDAYNRPAPGQPELWCRWIPCLDGHCLTWDGHEKPYQMTQWLSYLIDTFLRPEAAASSSGDSLFQDFSFDHVCNGVVAGSRRDTGRLYLIWVDGNEVEEETLMPGIPEEVVWGPLPFQQEIDRWRDRKAKRKAAYGARLRSTSGLRSASAAVQEGQE